MLRPRFKTIIACFQKMAWLPEIRTAYQFPLDLGIGILIRFGVPGPPPEKSQAKMAIERITAMVRIS